MGRLVFMLPTLITILFSGLMMMTGLSHKWSVDSGFNPSPMLQTPEIQSQSLRKISINGQILNVEVAQTPRALTEGLSGRSRIGSDGMLFILPSSQVAQFWMKDMLFDLDFVWIGHTKILGITADVPKPQPSEPDIFLPFYYSPPDTDMVLEVPAGTVKTYGWQEGDQVVLW